MNKYKVGDYILWTTDDVSSFTKGIAYLIRSVEGNRIYLLDDNGNEDYWYFDDPTEYFELAKNQIIMNIIKDL